MKAGDSEVSCLPAGSGKDSHPPGMLHQRQRSISAADGFASSQPRLGRSHRRAEMTHVAFFRDANPRGPPSRWLLCITSRTSKYGAPNSARI